MAEYQGAPTRDRDGKRIVGQSLEDQAKNPNLELIGMRSGVPIYADKTTGEQQQQPEVSAAAIRRTMTGEPVRPPTYFSKEYAEQFKKAQAEANKRAVERISYPRRDLPTSTSESTARAAAAINAIAKEEPAATGQQVLTAAKSLNLNPRETKQLMWGVVPERFNVGPKLGTKESESYVVTPTVLDRLIKKANVSGSTNMFGQPASNTVSRPTLNTPRRPPGKL